MATQQPYILTFQDPAGNPLAGGRVEFRLNVDISTASSSGPQICAGRIATATLDNNGSCVVSLWPNDTLLPSGSVYVVTAYTALGEPAWSGQITATTSTTGYILQEDGSVIVTEDGTGFILTEV